LEAPPQQQPCPANMTTRGMRSTSIRSCGKARQQKHPPSPSRHPKQHLPLLLLQLVAGTAVAAAVVARLLVCTVMHIVLQLRYRVTMQMHVVPAGLQLNRCLLSLHGPVLDSSIRHAALLASHRGMMRPSVSLPCLPCSEHTRPLLCSGQCWRCLCCGVPCRHLLSWPEEAARLCALPHRLHHQWAHMAVQPLSMR
jgi:hypothetical protein